MNLHWLTIAKNLKAGESKRFRCVFTGCKGEGSALLISNKPDKYTAYCFRCGKYKQRFHGACSISKLKAIKETRLYCNSQKYTISLPKDFTNEIPEEYSVWLYKASVFKDTALKYNFGWSNKLKRVVLPVYKDSDLVYIQCRAVVKGMQPKYLNLSNSDKSNIVFESKRSKHLINNVVVLTEDILSSVRTGVYLKSYSSLGTKITDSVAYALSSHNVIIWYDNDKAGKVGSLKVYKKLKQLGCNCIIYTGIKDPKYYTNSELKTILKEVSECLIGKK